MSVDEFLKNAGGAAELIAALTGFLCWKKIKGTYWQWFPVYLLVVAVAESLSLYCTQWRPFLQATVFPFFIVPLEFIFFTWLFSRQFTAGSSGKYLCWIGLAVYGLAFTADQIYFADRSYWFYSFSYSVGNIILLVLIITYLVRFSKGNEVIRFKVTLMFWVCLGLIFFYLGSFPFFGFINTLYRDHIDIFYPYMRITFTLNILMYLLFTTGFLCAQTK